MSTNPCIYIYSFFHIQIHYFNVYQIYIYNKCTQQHPCQPQWRATSVYLLHVNLTKIPAIRAMSIVESCWIGEIQPELCCTDPHASNFCFPPWQARSTGVNSICHIVCGSGCNCFFWPVLNNVPCQLFECGHVCRLLKRYSRWVSFLWVSASRCQCLGTILRGLYLCGLLSESQSQKWIIVRQSWKWYGKLLSNSKSRKDMERLDLYLCYILYVLNGISIGNQWKPMRFRLFEDFGARITGCHYMWYLWDNLQLDFSWSTTAGYVQHGGSASFLLGRTHS